MNSTRNWPAVVLATPFGDDGEKIWQDGCGISQEDWYPVWKYFEMQQYDAYKYVVTRKKRMWSFRKFCPGE